MSQTHAHGTRSSASKAISWPSSSIAELTAESDSAILVVIFGRPGAQVRIASLALDSAVPDDPPRGRRGRRRSTQPRCHTLFDSDHLVAFVCSLARFQSL